jgi:hypothetical protein
MERRINKKINSYLLTLKDNMKKHILHAQTNLKEIIHANSSKNTSNINEDIDATMMELLQSIFDYENLVLQPEDYAKRKRTKNNIPLHEQCIAKRANGQQCSRRKKGDYEFCGTHSKGTPHGIVSKDVSNNNEHTNPDMNNKKVEVWLEDINGIMYYIDGTNNIYDTSDILNNNINPKIIAKYSKSLIGGEEVYSILQSSS